MIGDHIEQAADSLLDYGVANVYLYEDARPSISVRIIIPKCLRTAFSAVIRQSFWSARRSAAVRLPRAPRRASRTGLTADCTVLEMRENTDLVQIRPAFGGNIMAQILNTNHRPQFATVRYKVMDPAVKQARIGKWCPVRSIQPS